MLRSLAQTGTSSEAVWTVLSRRLAEENEETCALLRSASKPTILQILKYIVLKDPVVVEVGVIAYFHYSCALRCAKRRAKRHATQRAAVMEISLNVLPLERAPGKRQGHCQSSQLGWSTSSWDAWTRSKSVCQGRSLCWPHSSHCPRSSRIVHWTASRPWYRRPARRRDRPAER